MGKAIAVFIYIILFASMLAGGVHLFNNVQVKVSQRFSIALGE